MNNIATITLSNKSRLLLTAGIFWLTAGYAIAPTYRIYQVGLCFALWLPALIWGYQLRRQLAYAFRTPPGALFLAFTLWSALSLLWRDNPDYDSPLRALAYTWLSMTPVAIAAAFRPSALARQLMAFSIPVAIMIGAGLVLWFMADRPEGRAFGLWNLDNVAGTGRYTAVFLLFAANALASGQRWRSLQTAAILALSLMLILSVNRHLWGALLLGVMPLLALRLHIRTLLLGLVTIGGAALLFDETIIARGLSLRPETWQGGLSLWLDHWWLGLGLGADYTIPIARHIPRDHAHNIFIHSGITLGAVGFTLFTSLWVTAGHTLWKHRGTILGLLGCCLWILSTTAINFDSPKLWGKPGDMWFVTWLPVALAIGLSMTSSRPETASTVDNRSP